LYPVAGAAPLTRSWSVRGPVRNGAILSGLRQTRFSAFSAGEMFDDIEPAAPEEPADLQPEMSLT
jgi:hypothetical protein